MELRVPMKVGGRMRWPRVSYRREDGGAIIQKTISVSGNPLTHLRIEPWLEEGIVHAAPEGLAVRNPGCHRLGYHFEARQDASVTIGIKK